MPFLTHSRYRLFPFLCVFASAWSFSPSMKSNNEKNFRDLSAEFGQLQLAVKQFAVSNTSEEIHNGSGN